MQATGHVLAEIMIATGLLLVTGSTVLAEQRPGPEATQHALDNLANECQIERNKGVSLLPQCITPTSTPRPTDTVVPATASATTLPASTQEVPTAAPTQLPALPVTGEPIYTRAMGDPWLELATLQGRWWAITDCGQVWLEGWLSYDEQQIVLHTDSGDCTITGGYSWASDAPCATDDSGQCEVSADDSYWYILGLSPTETPVPAQPTVARAAPTTVVPRAAAPNLQPAAPAPRPQTIIQTVVVTAVPSATPTAARAATQSATPTPTQTVTPRPVNSATVAVSPVASPATTNAVNHTAAGPDWAEGPLVPVIIVGIIVAGVGGTLGFLLLHGRL